LAVLLAVLMGCASQGPVVPKPPTVRVGRLESLSFTPDLIKFEAQVLILNNMPVAMDFQRTDYAVDLFDTELFADSFSGMKRTSGNGTQTVTFPFQIAMDDVVKQAPQLASEGKLKVTFRGEVFSGGSFGFDPIPFAKTIEIEVPQPPMIAFVGTQGAPLSQAFRILFTVTNPNDFPFTVDRVETSLTINDRRFPLLHSLRAAEIPAGGTGTVVLQMETPPEKTLRMALTLGQSGGPPTMLVTGGIRCGTPYGWVLIPVNVPVPVR
jgi:hypothetical protein